MSDDEHTEMKITINFHSENELDLDYLLQLEQIL